MAVVSEAKQSYHTHVPSTRLGRTDLSPLPCFAMTGPFDCDSEQKSGSGATLAVPRAVAATS